MASTQVASVTRRIEEVSGVRPVTLLIATGIALITAILLVTGIAANHLRKQALHTADRELARVGSVLAAAANRTFNFADAELAELADRVLSQTPSGASGFRAAASSPETGALLRDEIGQFRFITAAAVIAANGEVLNQAGAWPADFRIDETRPGTGSGSAATNVLGAAIPDPRTGALGIPLIHRIDDKSGQPIGAVVGIVSAAEFTALFAAATLPPDAVIMLRRPDGSLLARYPEQAGGHAPPASLDNNELAAVFRDTSAWIIRYVTAREGEWKIEAWRALPDNPAAVAVSRSADQILAEWSYQGLWFIGFALVFSIVIGVMVYLIAHQFQTHETLSAMREERIHAEKIESENARLAAEAELLKSERLSVLGQLTATVAHELRNPLSAIRNTLFTVKELAANSGLKLDRPIGRMERSIERCDRIISDLLEYTRNRELARTGVRFDRWLADMLAEQSVKPPIVLTSRLEAGDAVVSVDADRIRRVVINLVENAAQAFGEMPADREQQIVVRSSVADGEVLLTVEDTGPGIAPENLDRIFEPLFSTKSFGTGLGLPTVKQIVNQHGGTITVDSALGQGTCVTVRLPLQPRPEPQPEASDTMKVAA